MPLYEFKCLKCSKVFDKLINFEEISTIKCCDVQATRVFSPVDFQFRGTGFYATDYKKQKLEQESKNEGV